MGSNAGMTGKYMKKKILFVNTSLTSGGSERVMTLLANEFAARNHEVVMALVRDLKPDTYQLDSRIECIRFDYRTKKKWLAAIRKVRMLRSLMKRGQFDAVVSFMYDINVATLLSAWKLKVPVIVSERNNPGARKVSAFYHWIEYQLYRTAKYMVFQTEQVKNMFPEDIQGKGVVIPNPINDALPLQYGGVRKKEIIAAGRLRKQKNFSMLVKAFAAFHRDYPEYVLTIYGIGPLKEQLELEASEEGVKDFVRFPGYISGIAEAMREAAMYVSSSDYEGISNSMLEALAMGVPCICTDCPVGGAAMMIQSGVNGILVPVGGENELYEAMKKIAGDEKYAESLSRNAVKVREDYSIRKIADQWESLLE